MQNAGMGRSRLFVFVVLALAGVLAPAGAAQADNVVIDELPGPQWPGAQNQADVLGPAGSVQSFDKWFSQVPLFNVSYGGLSHLQPGSQVKVSMNPGGPENAIFEEQTFTLPSTWQPGSTFSFRPILKWRMSPTLGRFDQFVGFTLTGTCASGFGDCIVGNPMTMKVHSESRARAVPAVTAKPASDGSGIDVSWTDSPDVSQITHYRVDRYTPDNDDERSKWWHGLDKNSTTFHDTTVEPGKRYCYYVTAWLRNDLKGWDDSSDRSQIVCTRINRAPSKPGTPSFDPTLARAQTTVSWGPATDPDGDGVMYELQHKNSAPGAEWKEYWKGFSSNTLGVLEQGGTWQYRVRAFDNDGATSEWSEVSAAFVADSTGPGVPKLRYDQEPSDNGWFKGPVTVTFHGAEDSPLPDGSTGGGVADPEGYPEPAVLNTHGEDQRLRPQAIDRVGNEGAMVTRYVNVDMKAPAVAFDECPTEVLEDTNLSLRYTASDEGSGLVGNATGTVDAVTSAVGSRTEKITVRDRVGHETTAECTFDVYANSPPPAVGNLTASEPISGDGDLSISWDASIDPDSDPVDYTVEEVGTATPLAERHDATSYRLEDVPEGTHTYRVTAFDNPRRTHADGAQVTVKVDKTGPTVKGSPDRDPDYGDWYKDRVEVSFAGSTDPALADGTDGSGVASYSDPKVLTASGTAHGTATDHAGNTSTGETPEFKVDATAPKVTVSGCPTEAVLERTPVTVKWRASDDESGLATAEAGDTVVDTRVPGKKTVAIPTAADRVGHETTTEACVIEVYANTAPTAPTGLVDATSPRNEGEFDLSWQKGGDIDLGAGDSITYTVEQRDEDSDWTTTAEGLTSLSRHVDVGSDDGTYRFRVRTVDSFGATSDSVEFAPVKVDREAPSRPAMKTDPAEATNGWFKDSVTVSFHGSVDPALDDTSAGSGVAGYTQPRTFSQTGSYEVSGTATDKAGNESAATDPATVRVDADEPTAGASCPTGTLTVGQPVTVAWTAQDEGSGLETPASGTLRLDTSSPGTKTTSADPVRDRVGHVVDGASCTYSVAYKFAGFLSPINGTAVNSGKTGRTYPIKWRLQRHDGSLISDGDAQALVAEMSAGQKAVSCSSFSLMAEDVLEEAATGGTVLRYDAGADQFIYNYKAPSTTGCYVLGVRNADGHNTKQVNFTFTR